MSAILIVPSARAIVLVSDDFGYPNGDLAGSGNGGGFSLDRNNRWTAPWQNGTDNPAHCAGTNSGLSCYAISGGQVESKPTIGGAGIQGVERPFNTDLAPGTTAYFGFDLKRFSAGAGMVWGMYLDEPNIAHDGGPLLGSSFNLVEKILA